MSLKYPVGVETFSEIIDGNYVYADKTELIYRLVTSGKYFFLSRPRRFGKSLTLSTIEAYFEGRRDLFKGLWLDSAEGVDWTPRPVLRLNFVSSKQDNGDLEAVIHRHLCKWENRYKVQDINTSLAQRFFNVIERAYETTGQKVVVLVDEYDKALFSTIGEPELHARMQRVLKPLFSILKEADRYIHFALLTGVSRFSKLSIFSDLNNLEDISLQPTFAALCGITEDEIRRHLSEGVEAFARELDTDFDGMMQILKDNYDGYHFARVSPDIYNPYSLILALKNLELSHRWFESGTPSFLLDRLADSNEDLRGLLAPVVSTRMLSNTLIADTNMISMLFQTGYLTIKAYDREEDTFTLGLPNREVETGMFEGLLPYYTGRDMVANDNWIVE